MDYLLKEAAKAKHYRRVMEYYADTENWRELDFMDNGDIFPYTKEIEFDHGNRAREIIEVLED